MLLFMSFSSLDYLFFMNFEINGMVGKKGAWEINGGLKRDNIWNVTTSFVMPMNRMAWHLGVVIERRDCSAFPERKLIY